MFALQTVLDLIKTLGFSLIVVSSQWERDMLLSISHVKPTNKERASGRAVKCLQPKWQVVNDALRVAGDAWKVSSGGWQVTSDGWREAGRRWPVVGGRLRVAGRRLQKVALRGFRAS